MTQFSGYVPQNISIETSPNGIPAPRRHEHKHTHMAMQKHKSVHTCIYGPADMSDHHQRSPAQHHNAVLYLCFMLIKHLRSTRTHAVVFACVRACMHACMRGNNQRLNILTHHNSAAPLRSRVSIHIHAIEYAMRLARSLFMRAISASALRRPDGRGYCHFWRIVRLFTSF